MEGLPWAGIGAGAVGLLFGTLLGLNTTEGQGTKLILGLVGLLLGSVAVTQLSGDTLGQLLTAFCIAALVGVGLGIGYKRRSGGEGVTFGG
jgi:hypothetical protein